ncbi:hypothetical protein LF1_14690 [Rubripirellula obstinata]|uniref:DUF4365 domain-containing protein n=1 Tax=Rubripirellula obstinata TaxID=406547 RepID=A0A5B1CG87_9BACT|nr:hypothetical protein [Rubripirellula obstinata]KAA1258945.1 hypothetical protein LF1_14690 [Rubripirellula obstinata]
MTELHKLDSKNSRAPKQLGDFGEGLVTYTLIRKGFEVACVDHVGADLIAQREHSKIAVSVKTRMFRQGSVESRGVVFEFSHLNKLEHFAQRFDLDPVLALAVCMADDGTIHLFIMRVADIRLKLKAVKHGYRFQFSKKHLPNTIALPFVDYSCWSNEQIGQGLFDESRATAQS